MLGARRGRRLAREPAATTATRRRRGAPTTARGVARAVIDDRDLDAPPADAADAYLRLHLLSHRLVRPHGVNLDGIFGVLPNVAWTSRGAVDPAALDQVRLRARAPAGRCRSPASTSSRG